LPLQEEVWSHEKESLRWKSQIIAVRGKEGVESNGCLAVKPKNIKMTYAKMVRVTTAEEAQSCLIGNGGDPIASLIHVDIKKK